MISLRAVSLPLFRISFCRCGWDRARANGGLVLASLLLVALTGCATGEYAYVKTISTGERIQIPLEKGVPVMAQKGNVTVRYAGLVPGATREEKELSYLFVVDDKSPTPPKAVLVEDVTEDHVTLMVEDLNPQFPEQRWSAKSRLFGGDDPEMVWISQLGDTMRVFRFTITAADGSKTVLNQGWMVPAWAKVPMRQILGVKL